MDFTVNTVLKENYTFFVADPEGMIAGGERGLYNRDTRFLSRYRWSFSPKARTLMTHVPRPERFAAHHAVMDGPSQLVGISRSLMLTPTRLTDSLTLENTSLEPQALTLALELESDFADLFEARGWHENTRVVKPDYQGGRAVLEYRAQDGVQQAVRLSFSQPWSHADESGVSFEISLNPKEALTLTVTLAIDNPLERDLPGPSYADWERGFPQDLVEPKYRPALSRAVQDLRALLLFTEDGPLPAAGIPWFVTAFGRDSLLSAYMLLPHHPEVARGTLRYLAARQGTKIDTFRAEAPGKILHEVRSGELSRTGKVPFSTYYGTVDATPLFVMLLQETYRHTHDLALVLELRPAWEAALGWMKTDGDPDGDGFLEFRGAKLGKGLVVQSWKDSHDSLSHRDGRLAEGLIAVSEVQGYAYAAYRAAAEFYRALAEPEEAKRWDAEAETMRARIHEAFWLEELGTYALALDGDKTPLRVQNSDAGHLLWTGVVPEEAAPTLVKTLFSEALWSGWGIRTLGTAEARYNPMSYHNGSVWPHDTALIAGGLARYGFRNEARRIREALFDLASSEPDLRPPELIAGYPRADTPPIPYPQACRPQAWDAAALLYLATLLE